MTIMAGNRQVTGMQSQGPWLYIPFLLGYIPLPYESSLIIKTGS